MSRVKFLLNTNIFYRYLTVLFDWFYVSFSQTIEEKVKEFMATKPIMSEFDAALRYYNVSCISYCIYRKTSSISRTKSPSLNVFLYPRAVAFAQPIEARC